MDTTATLIVLVGIQLVALAFASGKLWQIVNDLCRRVDRMEKLLNNKSKEI